MSSPLTVFRFSCWHFSEAEDRVKSAIPHSLDSTKRLNQPSLVMKEINSLTHSCMHSFASLAIFAFSGKAVFMIRATGAKFLMLASDVRLFCLFTPRGGGDIECGESRDIVDAH